MGAGVHGERSRQRRGPHELVVDRDVGSRLADRELHGADQGVDLGERGVDVGALFGGQGLAGLSHEAQEQSLHARVGVQVALADGHVEQETGIVRGLVGLLVLREGARGVARADERRGPVVRVPGRPPERLREGGRVARRRGPRVCGRLLGRGPGRRRGPRVCGRLLGRGPGRRRGPRVCGRLLGRGPGRRQRDHAQEAERRESSTRIGRDHSVLNL